MALAAIGTVICRKEVASEPPRLLPALLGKGDGVEASPAGSLQTEVTSSSLKLTLRAFDLTLGGGSSTAKGATGSVAATGCSGTAETDAC